MLNRTNRPGGGQLLTRLFAGLSVFAVAFFVAFISSSHFMPISQSSAETTNMSGTYYANITSSGSIDFDVDATPDGIGKVGKDTLSIDTNATTGYKLYLSTASSAPGNGLYLEDGASLDTNTKATASTGTLSEPAKLATNTWGYVPSRVNSSGTAQEYTDAAADAVTGAAVFSGVPVYGSEDIIYTNTSPSTSGTNSLDIYYGINFSTALPSGAYTNTVVYTAIVDAVNPDSEEVSISPASQTGFDAGTALTISTGLYPGLAASNLGNISVTIGGNACTSVTPSIGASGNLVISCNSPAATGAGKVDVVVTIEKYNKIYTLTEGYEYINPLPAFYTITTMQEMTSSVCNSVPKPSASATTSMTAENYDSSLLVENGAYVAQTTLSDIRDSNSYIVRKLADGSCWMRDNLTLDLPSGQTKRTLTPDDSDVTANWDLEDANNWCNQDTDACDNQKLISRTGYNNAPTYYYNWYTATAGTGTRSISSGNVTDSICPKGWKLPTTAQFSNLDKAYGGTGANRTDANQITNFTQNVGFWFTGFRLAASVLSSTSSAYYWSRSANSAANAYYLRVNSGNGDFNPQGSSNKYYGFAVRCVAATNMQDFSVAEHAADAVGTTYNLTDTRDNKEYSAKKLADGNIWMTQNLKLVGSRTLTSADSNVTEDFILPASDGSRFCTTSNSTDCDGRPNVLDSGNTSYGVYYNWYAATAGYGTYSMSSGDTSVSICPKGWRLPTNTEFQALYNNYNSASAMMDVSGPAFVLSGSRLGSSTYDQGSYGSYWSSTAGSSIVAYRLYLYSSNVLPQDNLYKYYGFTVRCVASS